MEAVLARQQQLEGINRRLCQGAAEVRKSIRDLDLPRDQYQELQNLPDDKISVQEHVAVSQQTLKGADGAIECGEPPWQRDRFSPTVFRCVCTRR